MIKLSDSGEFFVFKNCYLHEMKIIEIRISRMIQL